MVGREWTTTAEKDHLMALLPPYHQAAAKRNNEKSLARFWTKMNTSFFAEFPSRNSEAGAIKKVSVLDITPKIYTNIQIFRV
jgi:hypothetical protein